MTDQKRTGSVLERRYTAGEAWLASHLEFVAVLIVLSGLAVRLLIAHLTYFSGDEALHSLQANLPSLRETYASSLHSEHPPLFYLVMHCWRFLGNTELILRLPSVLLGTASLWVAFRWLLRTCGRSTALACLLMLACSPTMTESATEVRHYAMLLFFLLCALYSIERALDERTPRMMILFTCSLYLVILTHYSAVWIMAALGSYALLRVVNEKPPKRVILWLLWSGAGAILLCIFLYVTHLAHLHGGIARSSTASHYLNVYNYNPHIESLVNFLSCHTIDAFEYFFASQTAGVAALCLFMFAIYSALTARLPQDAPPGLGAKARRHALLVLLLSPFAFTAAASTVGLFPYGGTRQVLFLMPFAMAGACLGLARLAKGRLLLTLLLAGILGRVWTMNADAPGPGTERNDIRHGLREDLQAAISHLQKTVPPGAVLFLDCRSRGILGYYLGRDEYPPAEINREPILQSTPDCYHETYWKGFRIISTRRVWYFTSERIGPELMRMARAKGIPRGQSIWVFASSWAGGRKDVPVPGLVQESYRKFGSDIVMFNVVLPAE